MTTEINAFYIDHVQSNGSYMRIQKDNVTGFQNSDLQELQIKMLQSNHIPRLIPISFENVNDEIAIFYRIEGLRRFSSMITERPITMKDYYNFFINVIQALQDSGNYMLSEENYVINEDYIYVGADYHQVYLTYLPLNQINRTTSIYEDLKEMLLRVAGDVQEIHGSQFKKIIHYIKDPGFSLQGLKLLLQDLQGNQDVNHNVNLPNQNEMNEQEEETVIKKVKKLPPLTSKQRLYSILIAILLIAVSWKLSMDSNSQAMTTLSWVLTGLIVVGVIVYWFVWRPGVEPIITEKKVRVKKTPKKVTKTEKNIHTANPNVESTVMNENNRLSEISSVEKRIEINQQGVGQLGSVPNKLHSEENHSNLNHPITEANTQNELVNTVNVVKQNQNNKVELVNREIDHHNETLLLDHMEPNKELNKVENYLVTVDEDNGRVRPLTEENIVIGGAERGATILDNGLGVSRLHAELIKLSDTYGIKDLGSKNGTYINDERLTPHSINELQNNDEIRIGKSRYTYRITNGN